MSRPVWAAGLLVLALALPVQASSDPMPPAATPSPFTIPAATVSETTAIQVARSLFPSELVKGSPTVTLGPDYRDGSAWRISWEGDVMIHVTVDGRDGQVLSADRWQMGPTLPSTTRLTKAEAEAKAGQWLARLAPGAQSSLVAAKAPYPDYGSDSSAFSFYYDWRAMGYPVPYAGANLRIDAATGDLLGWYIDRPEGKMVLPPAILAESEARAAFQKLTLPLRYTHRYWMDEERYYKEPVPRTMLLAYRPQLNLSLTQSGTFIGPDGQPLPDVTIPTFKQVPPPVVPYKPPTKPLTKAEALAIAQAVSGQSREPDEVNIYRWENELGYNFGWLDWSADGLKPDSNEIHVNIDAVQGLVGGLYSGMGYRDGQPSMTLADAQQIAVDFMVTYRPDLAGAVYFPAAGPNEPWPYYTFQFERQYEGITVETYGGAELTIDGKTGRVVSFNANTKTELELDLPKPEGVLPPVPLMAKLVDLMGLELGWVQVRPAGEEPYLQLVWHLGRTVPVELIEAQTGIFRDMDGTDVLKFRVPPTDVAGHWAEREIQSLFEQRIVTVEGGRFMPEQAMTEAEATAWLTRLNYGMPRPMAEVTLIEGDGPVVAQGESNPAALITREAFVRYVVAALGYERIAGMKNQIWMPFHDQAQIEPGARNAVAVLNGLGVIQGTPEGNFLPKKSLTRAEAARILFQSLEHRRFGGGYYYGK